MATVREANIAKIGLTHHRPYTRVFSFHCMKIGTAYYEIKYQKCDQMQNSQFLVTDAPIIIIHI
jgi:hypothetical protein